jgi:hypothetical protein
MRGPQGGTAELRPHIALRSPIDVPIDLPMPAGAPIENGDCTK